jgi:hypothetical protein
MKNKYMQLLIKKQMCRKNKSNNAALFELMWGKKIKLPILLQQLINYHCSGTRSGGKEMRS